MSSLGKPVYDPILGAMRSGLKPGAGIDMSGGTVSVITPPEGVPYVAGDGVFISGATIGADLTAGAGIAVNGGTVTANLAAPGYRLNVSGGTVGVDRYMPITNVTGASVTLQAGGYYKINATTSAVTLNTETVPAGSAGLEGHAEIFVAAAGYIVTGANVVLANPLEPDAVNNCSLRFHDGKCIISVEDHVAGYIVVSATGTSAGSLYYGLGTASEAYIAVDASLNGITLDLHGVQVNAEKHLVGNGYQQTIVSGGIQCSSKTTFANLGMNNVTVSSGTLTLGDVYIPNGSTVAVSGGGLAVEKVTGAGSESVIDLGGTTLIMSLQNTTTERCTIRNGATNAGGCVYVASGSHVFSDCLLSGGSATTYGGIMAVRGGCFVAITGSTIAEGTAVYGQGLAIEGNNTNVTINDTLFVDNGGYYAAAIAINGTSTTVTIAGCTFGSGGRVYVALGTLAFAGSNTFKDTVTANNALIVHGNGSAVISSGAILDFTGNNGSGGVLMSPGGGITFEQGGAIVYPSAGQASAYMLGGMTVPTIGNTNVVNLGGSNVTVPKNGSAYASGCVFVGGSGNYGALYASSATLLLDGVTVSSCTGGRGAVMIQQTDGAHFTSCTFRENDVYRGDLYVLQGTAYIDGGCSIDNAKLDSGSVVMGGSNTIELIDYYSTHSGTVTISSGASINLTSSIAPGGGIVVDGGCTVNGVSVAGGTYSTITSSGGSAVVS